MKHLPIITTAMPFSQVSRATLTAFRRFKLSADTQATYLLMTMNCTIATGLLDESCTAKYISDQLGMSRKSAHDSINKIKACGMLTVDNRLPYVIETKETAKETKDIKNHKGFYKELMRRIKYQEGKNGKPATMEVINGMCLRLMQERREKKHYAPDSVMDLFEQLESVGYRNLTDVANAPSV